jgi:large subunit ribosomal protein L17
MHNRIGFNRLNRKPSHRKALHRNMVTSLIKEEKIKTTQAKAKEIRRTAEKLVTRAKVDSVHNRRIVAKTVYEKDAVNKLFIEVGPRFSDRPGGYTRILKLGKRSGDAAEMVILEFLGEDETLKPKKKASPKKKSSSPKKKPAAAAKAEKPEDSGAKEPEESKAEEAEKKDVSDASAEADEAEKKAAPADEAPAETEAAVDEAEAEKKADGE